MLFSLPKRILILHDSTTRSFILCEKCDEFFINNKNQSSIEISSSIAWNSHILPAHDVLYDRDQYHAFSHYDPKKG